MRGYDNKVFYPQSFQISCKSQKEVCVREGNLKNPKSEFVNKRQEMRTPREGAQNYKTINPAGRFYLRCSTSG